LQYSQYALLLAAFLGLAGCAPDQPLTYVPPPGLTAQTGASITGSLVKTGALADNEKVFIGEIDNQVTTQNGANLQVPLLVSPGLHVVEIVICECGGWAKSYSGSVSIAVNLQLGQRYVARAGIPASQFLFYAPDKTTMAWLEDGSGKAVAAPQQAMLTAPPAPVFIPIFISAR
jgi:hypothetical protein